ncbi:MAG: SGNH/GDSL hydrolase family protein, partial [Desulfobulbaceae bacterium]|nr:SGNH/GDSL hydrolase family protein [Desulfobulbaceae bacterium]
PLDKNTTNIFVLGGSTTFGYGVRDNETIPAQLEKLIKKRTPATRVYNFGRAFYFSTQERILLENLLTEGNIPDAVIFIDGLNDFYHKDGNPTFTGYLNGAMDNSFYAAQKKFFRELPVINLLNSYKESQNSKDSTAIEYAKKASPNDADIRAILNRYMANVRLVRAIADNYGIKSDFIWQPVPEYKMNLASHPLYRHEDIQTEANLKRGYELAKELFAKEQLGILWAAEISDTCQGNFVDKVHYSPKFCREIAEYIFTNKLEHSE